MEKGNGIERAELMVKVKRVPHMYKSVRGFCFPLRSEKNVRYKDEFRASAGEHEVEWAAEAILEQERVLTSASIPVTAENADEFFDMIRTVLATRVLDKRPDRVRHTIVFGQKCEMDDDYWRVVVGLESLSVDALRTLNEIPKVMALQFVDPVMSPFCGTVDDYSGELYRIAKRCAMFIRMCLSYLVRGLEPPYRKETEFGFDILKGHASAAQLFFISAIWQSLGRDGDHRLRYGPKEHDVFPCISVLLCDDPFGGVFDVIETKLYVDVAHCTLTMAGCSVFVDDEYSVPGRLGVLLRIDQTDLLRRVRTARVIAAKTTLPLKQCLYMVSA